MARIFINTERPAKRGVQPLLAELSGPRTQSARSLSPVHRIVATIIPAPKRRISVVMVHEICAISVIAAISRRTNFRYVFWSDLKIRRNHSMGGG
jgi:hypothetical protein